jgi:hypothetical protein
LLCPKVQGTPLETPSERFPLRTLVTITLIKAVVLRGTRSAGNVIILWLPSLSVNVSGKNAGTTTGNKMELLDKKDFIKAVDAVRRVTFNNLFARSISEQKVTGKIFVDNKNSPQTFYIAHPYGMTLLLGNADNKAFNEKFKNYALNTNKERIGFEWMQAFPDCWDAVLKNLFEGTLIRSADNDGKQEKGIVELNTRVNFKFSKDQYLQNRVTLSDNDIEIKIADRDPFRNMEGSVVPSHFWDSEDDFFRNGLAYALFYKGELASMAFSSYWFDDQFELGIETKDKFRGKGFAELVCSALIDHCISNDYEPIWACRLENISSYKLAQKLGFKPAIEIPYYRLSN